MNEKLLKEKVQRYFFEKKYDERIIPESHITLVQAIRKKVRIPIEAGSDRNYDHSTKFSLILNPEYGIFDGKYDFLVDREPELLKKTTHHRHWKFSFMLSMIDTIACYYSNVRTTTNNEIAVDMYPENELPDRIKQQLRAILK